MKLDSADGGTTFPRQPSNQEVTLPFSIIDKGISGKSKWSPPPWASISRWQHPFSDSQNVDLHPPTFPPGRSFTAIADLDVA